MAASQSGWQSAIDGSVGDSSMHDAAAHELKSATKTAARIEAGFGIASCGTCSGINRCEDRTEAGVKA